MEKKYEILLFDLDDTLIDNLENVKYAFTKVSEYLGKEYTEEEFNRWYFFDKQFWQDFSAGLITVPYDKMDSRFIPYLQSLRYKNFYNNEFDIDKALDINKLYINSMKEKVIPMPESKETLEYLSKKYTIIIATNGPEQPVNDKLSKISCLQYIDNVFSADKTKDKVTKPNKIYFEELLDYIKYHDKERILLIGDSPLTDIQGGMSSNIDTCWFNRNNEKLPTGYHPNIIINRLSQLIDIL